MVIKMGGALLAAFLVAGTASAQPQPAYHVVKTVPLGAPDRWDYVIYDDASHHVFVAHGDRVTVVDGGSGAVVGQVAGIPGGTHGVAFVPGTSKAYTDDGEAGVARAFDRNTLKTGATVKAQDDADAIAFDPASGHVLVVNGDPGNITVIDPKTDAVVATIDGGGKLEYGVPDGRGRVFVNGEAKHEIVQIDSMTNQVLAHWPMPGCQSPHGLAIDTSGRRLFSSCANAVMVVLNADTGQVLANVPIGRGSDAVVFDPKRRVAISSDGGSGQLTLVGEQGPNHYAVVGVVKTPVSGRTLGIDPQTGRLYLAAAEPDPVQPPKGRLEVKPGSLKLIFLDPTARP